MTGRRIFYRSLQKAKLWARKSNISTKTEWIKAYENGKIPIDIPRNPDSVYNRETICKCDDSYFYICNKKLICVNCSL